MITKHEMALAKEAFSGHSLIKNSECKSWFIKNPTASEYWFRVTWCPGNLLLSGDVGELVLTHYSAMPNWMEAASWVLDADYEYLMKKSDKKKEFDQEETIRQIICMADDYSNNWDDDELWYKLAELTNITVGKLEKAKPKIKEELNSLCEYFESPEAVYRFMGDSDWTGSYSYPHNTIYQYEALQLWSREVLRGTSVNE